MKKQFTFEFEEEQKNQLTFEYSPEANERLDAAIENGVPMLYLNRSGMITLAKTLIKIALGSYDEGFHLHLAKDWNAEFPERLIVTLHEPGSDTGKPAADRAEIKRSTTILS